MAGKIRLLSDEVIGKIAAGEVVERPSAAIKEMVENSLDAGATAITVEIRDGGISYFRVTDNGSGIMQSEIRMAFERHATSKITRSQDLFSIKTLGFRGEALASIAAVAHVTCTTRTKADESGIKVKNSGGRIESIEEAACPEGTTFVVRDLFYNTPVRLKFLKKPATEAGYVSDLMMRLILSRPDVSFRYISQGKTVYHSAGDGKLSSAVFSIYGRELLRSMREVDGCQAGLILKGYVGVGESGRASRGHQSFFINGRYMKSGLLSAAVEAACSDRVLTGRHPTCVLHLTMPYDLVDVNVHPNKLEVRFQNDQAVAEAIEAIVRDSLIEKSALDRPETMRLSPETPAVAPVTISRQTAVEPTPVTPKPVEPAAIEKPVLRKEAVKASAVKAEPQPVTHAEKHTFPAMKPLRPVTPTAQDHFPPELQKMMSDFITSGPPLVLKQPTDAIEAYIRSTQMPDPPPAISTQETMTQLPSFLPDTPDPMKLIGTVFNSYILVEYKDSLLLIDQHGVHERLLFDRMMRALDRQQCAQELLIPMIVPVTRREQELLEEHHDMLAAIGLTVEPFGETEASIRTIPMILGQPQAGEMLREVIDQLESERGVISLEKRRAGILALACRKAVKPGERLEESDLRELVTRMVEKNVTPTSPRGTPLIIALTKTDIDRRFRRMQ